MIRKSLHPEYYQESHYSSTLGEDELFGPLHLNHCVDSIRQSLMCNSDISVIVWQWDKYTAMSKPVGNVVHTCRNFERIRDWAFERRLETDFDGTIDLRGDPLAGVFDWEAQE